MTNPAGGDGSSARDPAAGLVCRSLTKRFPGVLALDHVDLDVRPGRVVVLLGENGAGKSTLAKILSGVVQPDEGTMHLNGRPYSPHTPAAAIAAGIGMIHQEMSLLPDLSVAENIFLGRQPLTGGLIDYRSMHEQAAEQLGRVGLRLDPRTPVRQISIAARQQVEIAKALSLDAQVLILDEATAALGADEAERLFELIHDLRRRGVAFIYISHRLAEVPEVGDEITVLRDGRRVAHWETADVPSDDLIEAMVGRTVDRVFPAPPAPAGDEVLRVEGLSRRGAFHDVSFTIRRGEVLGVAGLVGAGRTELVRALFGAEPADEGRIFLEGRRVELRSPADAVAAGIALVPEDRKEQGLVLDMIVQDNIVLASLEDVSRRGILRPSMLRRLTRQLMSRHDIRGRPTQVARTLSGGNQQKTVIAKWLLRRPKVVMFDDPTRGIDVGAKAAIYDLIQDLAEEGVAILLISAELPEVLGLSNRVLVLSRGRQAGLLDRSEANEERVMALAVSG